MSLRSAPSDSSKGREPLPRGEQFFLILNTFPASIQPGTLGGFIVSPLLHPLSLVLLDLPLSILTACLSLTAEDAWVP